MSRRCSSDALADPAERDQFVRDNAVALVAERDRLIARLRRKVTELERSRRSLRCHVKALRARLGEV